MKGLKNYEIQTIKGKLLNIKNIPIKEKHKCGIKTKGKQYM